jgi:hypothetical protein
MAEAEWQNGRMAEWQNGRMAEWQNGGIEEWRNGNDGMTEWQNSRMAEWQFGRMAEWRNGRIGMAECRMAEWQDGRMAEWRNGGMVFYYIPNLSCYIYGTCQWRCQRRQCKQWRQRKQWLLNHLDVLNELVPYSAKWICSDKNKCEIKAPTKYIVKIPVAYFIVPLFDGNNDSFTLEFELGGKIHDK